MIYQNMEELGKAISNPIVGMQVSIRRKGSICGTRTLIYVACKKCGKCRWINKSRFVGSTYRGYCSKCIGKVTGEKNSVSDVIYQNMEELNEAIPNPIVGTCVSVREKHSTHGTILLVYVQCEKCKEYRWISKLKMDHKQYTGYCYQCSRGINTREKLWNWKGDRKILKSGYIKVKIYPDNPYYSMAHRNGYIPEHRLVMAEHLGRCLESSEIVHHRGTKYPIGSKEDKGDNRAENLELFASPSDHAKVIRNELMELRTRITALETRNTILEAEVALLAAQLEKDGIQY